jgi:hypothetical protein
MEKKKDVKLALKLISEQKVEEHYYMVERIQGGCRCGVKE